MKILGIIERKRNGMMNRMKKERRYPGRDDDGKTIVTICDYKFYVK